MFLCDVSIVGRSGFLIKKVYRRFPQCKSVIHFLRRKNGLEVTKINLPEVVLKQEYTYVPLSMIILNLRIKKLARALLVKMKA